MNAKVIQLGDATKARILDAAETLFMEHGFEATSLRLITAGAGVNLAAVNYHFGTKEELFQAVLTRRLDPMNLARVTLLVQHVEPPREHRLKEARLPAEVVVDRREVDPRRTGDHPARRPVVPVLEEQALGGVQDAAGGGRTSGGARAGRNGGLSGRHRTKVSNDCLNVSPGRRPVKRRACPGAASAARRLRLSP